MAVSPICHCLLCVQSTEGPPSTTKSSTSKFPAWIVLLSVLLALSLVGLNVRSSMQIASSYADIIIEIHAFLPVAHHIAGPP